MPFCFKPSKAGSSKAIPKPIRPQGFKLFACCHGKPKPRIEGPFPYQAKSGAVSPFFMKKLLASLSGPPMSPQSSELSSELSSESEISSLSSESGHETAGVSAKLTHPNTGEHAPIAPQTGIMRDTGVFLRKIRATVRFSFYEDLYIYLEVLKQVKELQDRRIRPNGIGESNIILRKDGTVKIVGFDSSDIVRKPGNYIKRNLRDSLMLRRNLYSLLGTHAEIEESGNPNEKKHYALLKEIAQSKQDIASYSELMCLMTELEKMRDFFPKWRKQNGPPCTKSDEVTKL
ncbi:MAG: hypothetical protein C5B47_07230 [Verrucomicrobia bacterium]|nr:MAG: hypothetical protein C5B47_07230 [Verrucomicrobiota bacterium]